MPVYRITHEEHGFVRGIAWDDRFPDRRVFVDVVDSQGHVIRTCAARPISEEIEGLDVPSDCGFEVQMPPGCGKITARDVHSGTEFSLDDGSSKFKKLIKRTFFQKRSDFKSPFSELPEALDNPSCVGAIIDIEGGRIDVWIDGHGEDAIPMIFVNNKPAWPAPDRVATVNQSDTAAGYRFYISGVAENATIELWAIVGTEVVLCEARRTGNMSFERSVMAQLGRAAEIAQQSDAVAITCWDGGHNPIGRAKVLYDVIESRRPVVLFCFLFPEFGGDIWPPLSNQDLQIVTIPWQDRYMYLNMIQAMGLSFDTVWMCKPRMPTFHLAAYLCHDDTRLVLDLDDNEEHFSRSKASQSKAYGLPSIGNSRALLDAVPARTAASASLQKDFETTLVRHARTDSVRDQAKAEAVIKIGFIGTVRPHKRILEAADAIAAVSEETGKTYEFHVYGDVKPESLVQELVNKGVVIKQNVPLNQLQDHLRSLDIILSGFPSQEAKDEPITRYQISAKIGDALSVGRSILVPEGPSVEDLRDIKGVYLFNPETFKDAVEHATQALGTETVSLPKSFTIDFAYEEFQKAERRAESAERGKTALRFMPTGALPPAMKPTLLLIWKQHDGALYGRRVDMVCRQYRKVYPDHRIVLLEILYKDFDDRYRQSNSGLSETAFIREMNPRKLKGCLHNSDNIEYHQIMPQRSDQLNREFLEYLASNELLPTNTVVILYPNILHLDRVYDLLEPYPLITDVVDNQLAWASGKSKLNVSRQYYALTTMSDKVLFNSEVNRDYFVEKGFLTGKMDKVSLIPNWYVLPGDFDLKAQPPRDNKHFDIFYSGNMNDRIDWDLMAQIARTDPKVRLHLVGEAGRSQDELTKLLQEPNVIYHGVQNELRTLKLLSQADLTVMPHVTDNVSAFMNPLKVHMYAALGLKTIASDIPGIEASDKLDIVPDAKAFLAEVKKRIKDGQHPDQGSNVDAQTDEHLSIYTNEIEELRHRCRT